MSYIEDFNVGKVLQSIYGLGAQICNNVYTGNRPQATPEQMKEFIVVSVPGRLESSTYGGGYGATQTYCNVEVFVKLKKNGNKDAEKMGLSGYITLGISISGFISATLFTYSS